jgi:putative ABC transport system permease protein
VRGRTFTERDDASAPAVMVVSQSTARKFWGADDPIGRVVHRTGDGKNITVIGVVGDVRNTALSDESPAMYFSAVSRLWPLMDVVVRTSQDPEAALPAIRRKIQQLDAELPLATVRTMDQWVSSNAAQPRLNAALLSIFACVAMLVSAIGIYGVLAYSVNQRTREIGLRMALGAQRGSVLKLIIREGMTVALIGIGAGLAAAFVVSRLLASLLFGVEARDPATFAVLAGLLALIALAACAIPAWRASRVDPMVALRYE